MRFTGTAPQRTGELKDKRGWRLELDDSLLAFYPKHKNFIISLTETKIEPGPHDAGRVLFDQDLFHIFIRYNVLGFTDRINVAIFIFDDNAFIHNIFFRCFLWKVCLILLLGF